MAQLIRGTSITLYTAFGAETVGNVLIGEPSGSGYTVALPKGDTHDWTDRKIGFWGALWRTVGAPEQGIEANIPLAWNKKITVQPLKTNGSITVYAQGSFTRHLLTDVFLTDLRGQRTDKTGAQPDGDLTVRVYAVCSPGGYVPKTGDMLVPGLCTFEFDTSTEQAASESMAAFRQQQDYAVIRSCTAEFVGAAPDYIITAR